MNQSTWISNTLQRQKEMITIQDRNKRHHHINNYHKLVNHTTKTNLRDSSKTRELLLPFLRNKFNT